MTGADTVVDVLTSLDDAHGYCVIIFLARGRRAAISRRLGTRSMTHLISQAALLLALFLPLVASGAQAGVGDRAGAAVCAWKRASPIQSAQYYSFDDENYCWYDEGWQGPGWYWCGYQWDDGFGWGGPYGWNGWGGGYTIRRHRLHGIGVWHSGAPSHRLGAGGAPTAPGFPAGGAPATRRFGAGGGSSHRFGAAGASERPGPHGGIPAYPGLQGGAAPAFHGAGGGDLHDFGSSASPGFGAGGAPAVHGFGGGGGFQGFGVAGGFHGGGAFTGGHGGGHR
jgi:hypothetical protein